MPTSAELYADSNPGWPSLVPPSRGDFIIRVEWCPGNMSRYDLLFGRQGASYTLAWMHRGGSGGSIFRFSGDQWTSSGYVAEKMSINLGDAAAMCGFLNGVGFNAEAINGFDQDGNYKNRTVPPTIKGAMQDLVRRASAMCEPDDTSELETLASLQLLESTDD